MLAMNNLLESLSQESSVEPQSFEDKNLEEVLDFYGDTELPYGYMPIYPDITK